MVQSEFNLYLRFKSYDFFNSLKPRHNQDQHVNILFLLGLYLILLWLGLLVRVPKNDLNLTIFI